MSEIVYAAFDQVPAPKGAAVHIDAFTRALGGAFRSVDLVSVAPPPSPGTPANGLHRLAPPPPMAYAPGVTQHALPAHGGTLIERVLGFRSHLRAWWGRRRPDVYHFRSPFEGYPVASHKEHLCRHLVFEVNGLPSIELKYHYPAVVDDPELMAKLVRQEQCCLEAADLVLTVSQTNARFLESRGVNRARIRVIPNGVDTDVFTRRDPSSRHSRNLRVLYSGTLSAWQGIWVALDAMALLAPDTPASLLLVGPARASQRDAILSRAQDLGVADRVELRPPVGQRELAALHHASDLVIAPLMPNDRNLEQGCCPLKVLEAMACGTPLVASDLPVVRELVVGGTEAILVRPGSARSLAEGIRALHADPDLGARLAAAARSKVEGQFTWRHQSARLVDAYAGLLPPPGSWSDSQCRSEATSVSG